MNDVNVHDSIETIRDIVHYIKDNAFNQDKTDFGLCFTRSKNKIFIQRYHYTTRDIRSILNSLRIEDYCHTSKEAGKNDAYVFGPAGDDDLIIYLKVSIENEVLVISFHEADRTLSYPYRGN